MQQIQNPFETIHSRLESIENALTILASRQVEVPEKKFYSISEAAEKLGLANITIYRQVASGKIPIKRIGSRVLIPGSFLDKT